ncbi:helix-turn-helix domain-containing protein [Jiangella gansuensis]|uniref:helix-turn-helix domain-containing protein n=1 Tax=Jiangella gansuensis TaxID=281473 RepID=UPI00047A7A86|nr:helix-turn-helix domain-containing protein [Jiangella gansuensis]
MTVRIPMTAETLGRSRFGISPCAEVLGSLRALRRPSPNAPQLARWSARAGRSVPDGPLELLSGLVSGPSGIPAYVPDLLTPPPTAAAMAVEDEAAVIAATPADLIDYQLDIAFRGRPIPPEVAASAGGPERLDATRRPMPDAVATALRGGPRRFAERVAEAVHVYFDQVIAPDWPRVLDVLTAEVAYRGDRMAQYGALALLDDIHPDLRWEAGSVLLRKPFDVLVDWAHDGLLLIPSAGAGDAVWLNAERPTTPSVIYPARGLHQLWAAARPGAHPDDLGELLGHTRAGLLAALDRPRTTAELSRDLALTPSTVSYHLGILHRTGLVTRRRTGRRVAYARSDLAAAMLGE